MLLKRSKSTQQGAKREKCSGFPGDHSGRSREEPCGDSSHEHVVIARRGKVVGIRPGKKFRAESNRERELRPAATGMSQEIQGQPGEQAGGKRRS